MESLATRIERDGPINELDAVGWAIRLAKRVEVLHGLGVFHGSLSPACIEAEGSERGAKGRLADVRTTSGNLGFQSPERVLGGDLSTADDTWAVAATLFALLTGSGPFAAGSDDEVKQKITTGAPAPLAVFDVGDDDLQHLIDSALAREKAQRMTSIGALRQALEAWHPDPTAKQLAPLDDDEEATGGDDQDERTMLRASPMAMFEPRSPRPAAGARPAFAPRTAPRVAPEPVVDPQTAPLNAVLEERATPSADDDDENAKTVMREFPTNIAEAARSAAGRGPPPAPPPPPAAPRPAAGRPPEPPRMSALFAPAGGAGHGMAPVQRSDDDESDLQATVMRDAPALPPELAQRLDAVVGGSKPWSSGAPSAPQPPPQSGFANQPQQHRQQQHQQHPHQPQHQPMQQGPRAVAPGTQPIPVWMRSAMPQPSPQSSGPLGHLMSTQGMPAQGMQPQGLSSTQSMQQPGMQPQGMQPQGMQPQGMSTQAMPAPGMPPHGMPSGMPLQGPPSGYGGPMSGVGPQSGPGMPPPHNFAPPHVGPHGMPQQPLGHQQYGGMPSGPAEGMPPHPMPQPGFPQPGYGPYGAQPGAFGAPQPMQVPQPPPFDGSASNPFRQRSRGITVTAVFALFLTAAATFLLVRYGGCI